MRQRCDRLRFVKAAGKRVQDHWRGEHGGGEEKISFNGAAEEGQAGAVAGHQSGEGHRVQVFPGSPDGEVTHQEKNN